MVNAGKKDWGRVKGFADIFVWHLLLVFQLIPFWNTFSKNNLFSVLMTLILFNKIISGCLKMVVLLNKFQILSTLKTFWWHCVVCTLLILLQIESKNNGSLLLYDYHYGAIYLYLSLETVSLTKTLFQNKIQEKLITNTKGTHYSPQYIWFNKALSLNIIWIFEIPTTKPFHSYRLAFLRYFKFLLETPIKMCIYLQTKPHWQKYNLHLPIIVFSMSC